MSVQNYLAGFTGILMMVYLVGFVFTFTIAVKDGVNRRQHERSSKYMAIMAMFVISAVWPLSWFVVMMVYAKRQKNV